jgi:hypothetical protein
LHFKNHKSLPWKEIQRLILHGVGKNKLQSLDKTCKNDSMSVHGISPQGR